MTREELEQRLAAAEETIAALRKRMVAVEGGDREQPFHRQLRAYQHRLEEEQVKLKKSENWARLLVENSLDAIVAMDQDGLIIHWNPRAESLFGWRSAEVCGKLLPDVLVREENRQNHADALRSHIEGVESGTMIDKVVEIEALTRDGHLIPLEVAVSAMLDEGSTLFVAMMRDISKRKQAEHELRQSNENLERLVRERTKEVESSRALLAEAQSAAQIGTSVFDLSTGRWQGDAITNDIFGISEAYCCDIKGWMKLVDQSYRKQARDFLKWGTHSEGRPYILEVPIVRHSDREIRWIIGHAKPMNGDDGHPEKLIGTIQDITERKLFEENFAQTQKMEAVGTLVGGVAHEFNNSLAGITGHLYLAKNKAAEQPDTLRHLEQIEKLSFRAAEMIQQMLAFSKKSPVSLKVINLSAFIREGLRLHSLGIPENIAVHSSLTSEPLTIEGDEVQIQQIMVNLVNNARDAVEGVRHPEIHISFEKIGPASDVFSTHPEMKQGYFGCLRVTDNGCGISAESQSRIFEPFFTTKEVGKGTGLGLAMVYGAVQMHNGVIDINSQPGSGTTFTLYFPLLEKGEGELQSESFGPAAIGYGETILLVDDEPGLRAAGREVLESLGYSVLEAENGRQALESYVAEGERIELVILDVVMPVMGGVEAANAIWSRNPAAKIIFCTGYDKDDVLDGKHLLGKAEVFGKPYRVEEMTHLIRRMINSG